MKQAPFNAALSTLLLCAAGCSSGGGNPAGVGGPPGQAAFQLTTTNVAPAAVWRINRKMEFSFTEDVDFSTVSLNTISIQTPSGAPASGTFSFKTTDVNMDGIPEIDRKTIVFQPTCPTREDLSDAGLTPGGTSYVVRILGETSGAVNMVRSIRGKGLEVSQVRTISTPVSVDPSSVFEDTVNGPPVPVIRDVGSTEMAATYIELGADDSNRLYLEFDGTDIVVEDPTFEAPLNLYSDPGSRVAVVIEFNQPVSPRARNLSEDRLRLEFQDGTGAWRPVDTRVTLVRNCSATGATVKLEALGILPEASRLRAVVGNSFEDLAQQDAILAAINDFADVPTRTVAFMSLSPAEGLADELLEEFTAGGSDNTSFQDETALFATAQADWGSGRLAAGFDFEGSGGPNGDFDVVIKAGQLFLFDTQATVVQGGPGGVAVREQNAVNGVLDVRHFTIEPGGIFRAEGPNPLRINATGNVTIRGTLDVSGFDAADVGSLNSGNIAAIGGKGACGGGNGGDASKVLTNSTPKGDAGFGAFQSAGGGGEGGESGGQPGSAPETRRPAGGGGGRFGPDQVRFTADGMDIARLFAGEPGNDGLATAPSAIDPSRPARGGARGPIPFSDGVDGVRDGGNDFLGVQAIANPADPQNPTLIRGELGQLFAGSGGGGGGDALALGFPPTAAWGPGLDEKAGGGGGGSGGVNVRALGKIVFGASGVVRARGGQGANGEHTNFTDSIGGNGGGGSGGHVVLESALQVDFTDDGANQTHDGLHVFITTNGGFGGLGDPRAPADPITNDHLPSIGGIGGPGIAQLHVPDPLAPPDSTDTANIRVPSNIETNFDPVGTITGPPAFAMVPLFSNASRARSRWISIGGADQRPDGLTGPIDFQFDGLDLADPMSPDYGKLLTAGGKTVELPVLLGPEDVGTATVSVLNASTLVVEGASLLPLIMDVGDPDGGDLKNDVYLRTPSLLKNFTLRLETASGSDSQDFTITSAIYDDEDIALAMETDPFVGTLSGFIAANAGETVRYTIIPRFFRIVTGGALDRIPGTGFVRILFEATGRTNEGLPNEDPAVIVGPTPDISAFNMVPEGSLKFFRFEVEFNLGDELTKDTNPITLDFLRVPFAF